MRSPEPARVAPVVLDGPLDCDAVAAVAQGASLSLSKAAIERLARARALVEAIVEKGIRAYGVNTGVGALCNTVIAREDQQRLSRNLVMSHAVGVGPALPAAQTRAIMAAAVNNLCHGYSGVRPLVVQHLLALLVHDVIPDVPERGSVGYLTHMAHIALVTIGAGRARMNGNLVSGADALAAIGLEPLVLEAKEGLSLINGTPCATGLAALAIARARALIDAADVTAALTFEASRGQIVSFDERALALKLSPGLQRVGQRLRTLLADSSILAEAQGARTQDPLSLRTIPHMHGAARDALASIGDTVERELGSVCDNPIVLGTPEAPEALSEAHAVAPALALAMDQAAVALAGLAAMAERRLDRLVNPLTSGLPAFLAEEAGVGSGFMIAQYTAVSLVAENRRLASPVSLDGGITSGLQEDQLCHPTTAAQRVHTILNNFEAVLAIEWLVAAQAIDLMDAGSKLGVGTGTAYRALRKHIPPYRDDRPLADDIAIAAELIRSDALADA